MTAHFAFKPGDHNLTQRDWKNICEWAGIQPEADLLMAAGAARNAERWVQAAGLKMLAVLLEEHGMEPGEDPVELLRDLLTHGDL